MEATKRVFLDYRVTEVRVNNSGNFEEIYKGVISVPLDIDENAELPQIDCDHGDVSDRYKSLVKDDVLFTFFQNVSNPIFLLKLVEIY
jgi:hypothetical protein